jgi:hypothetical protein
MPRGELLDINVELPEPLWIRSGSLGSKSVKIGSVPTRLVAPHPAEPIGEHIWIVPLVSPNTSQNHSRRFPPPDLTAWGNLDTKQDALLVRGLRVVVPLPSRFSLQEEATFLLSFEQAFLVWYSLVRDWLCAWTGEVRNLGYGSSGERTRTSLFHAAVRRPDASGQQYGTAEISLSIASHGSAFRAANAEEVEAAMSCASRHLHIPDQIEYLKRAQSKVDRVPSESVIDSCTAVEVSLSRAIGAILKRHGLVEAAIERVLMQANGVDGLYRLLQSFDVDPGISRNNLQTHLAEFRDRAVHRGDRLDREAALGAYRSAAQLISTIDPVPSPSQTRQMKASRSPEL